MTPTMYPYLSYRDAASALRFLEEAFRFTTIVRWDAPDGTVQHAEATFRDGALIWQKRGRHERAQRRPERGSRATFRPILSVELTE
jgi:uncharacterized glyoxalase superfamily protein PhnB